MDIPIQLDNNPHELISTTHEELYHFPAGSSMKNRLMFWFNPHNWTEQIFLKGGEGNASFDHCSFYLSFPAEALQLDKLKLEGMELVTHSVSRGHSMGVVAKDDYNAYVGQRGGEVRICILFKQEGYWFGKKNTNRQDYFTFTVPELVLKSNFQSKITLSGAVYDLDDNQFEAVTQEITCKDLPSPISREYENCDLFFYNSVGGKTFYDLFYFPPNLDLTNSLVFRFSDNWSGYIELESGSGNATVDNCSFYVSIPNGIIQHEQIDFNDLWVSFTPAGTGRSYTEEEWKAFYEVSFERRNGALLICVLFRIPVIVGREIVQGGDGVEYTYTRKLDLCINDVLLIGEASTSFTPSGRMFGANTELEREFNIHDVVDTNFSLYGGGEITCKAFPKAVPTLNENLALHFQNTSGNTSDVLFIQDDTEDGDNIELIVGTEEGTPAISLFSESVTASRESFSFSFKFTPSSIEKEMKVMDIYTYVNDEWRKALEGEWSIESVINDDKSLVIYCLSRQSVSFNRPHSVKLVMRGVKPVVRKSSSPKVELYLRDSNYLNEYFCSQPFNIVSHAGDRYMPIKVAVDGWQLLNNGTANRVVLTLVNDHKESIIFKKSTIEVSWDISETESFALSKDSVTADSVRIFDKPVELPGIAEAETARYLLKGYSGRIEPGDSLPITIANLKTNLPAGTAKIYIRYYDVPEYWDGVLEVPLMRTSVFQADQEHIGIGTNNPKTKLHIADGSVSIGTPTTEVPENSLWVDGTIGIGTIGPTVKLAIDVPQDNHGLFIVKENYHTYLPYINGVNYISGKGLIVRGEDDQPNIEVDGSTGNVGIGAESGDNKLTVAGSVSIGRHDESITVPENSLWVEGQVGIGIIRTKVKLAIGVPEENTGLYIERGDYETHLPYVNGWNYISGKGLVVRGEGGLHNIEVDGSTGNVGIGAESGDDKLAVAGSVSIGTHDESTAVPENSLWVEGRVGIGMINPEVKLAINVPENNHGLFIAKGNYHTYLPYINGWNYITGPGTVIRGLSVEHSINFNGRTGNVGIGKGPDNSNKLSVNGTISSSRGLCSSDERWKHDIQPLQNSLQKLKQLTGVNYRWRTEEFKHKNFPEQLQIGFIAQEVEALYPELIHNDEKGYKSMNYASFSAALLEGLKEQQEQIEALSEKIRELEKNAKQPS